LLFQQGVEKGCIFSIGRHSRETFPRMLKSGSGNPEIVDFKEPGFPIKPFGNDGFGYFNILPELFLFSAVFIESFFPAGFPFGLYRIERFLLVGVQKAPDIFPDGPPDLFEPGADFRAKSGNLLPLLF
jgi:hypothetical protein